MDRLAGGKMTSPPAKHKTMIKPGDLTILMVTSNNRMLVQLNLATLFHYCPELPRILVVDRGSTDGTREYLASLPQVEVFDLPAIPGDRIEDTQTEHAEGLEYLIRNHLNTPWALSLDTDVEFLRPGLFDFLSRYEEYDMSFSMREGYPNQIAPDALYFLAPCPHPSFLLFKKSFLDKAYEAGQDILHHREPMLPWYNRIDRWWVYHYETFGTLYRWAYQEGTPMGYIAYESQDIYYHYGSFTVMKRCPWHGEERSLALAKMLDRKWASFSTTGLPLPANLRGSSASPQL